MTHYLMVGDKATHRPMLQAYLNAFSQGATQEQAAAQTFGDLKKLQAALFAYIGNAAFLLHKSTTATRNRRPAICRCANFPMPSLMLIGAGSLQCVAKRRRR